MKHLRGWLALLFTGIATLQLLADQSVTLAWNPNPEPDIAAYVIYYGNTSRMYPYATNVGNVTTATVYGLVEGKVYFFAVTALNTSGLESDFSNEVTNDIPANVTNNVPQIEPIGDMVLAQNQSTNIAVGVTDIETPPGQLVVTATSTNQMLLANTNLTVTSGGSDHYRTLTIAPQSGQFGKTLVTVVVSDGTKAASTSFLLTVLDVPAVPMHYVFRSRIEAATNIAGPWIEILTTHLPIQLEAAKFYRTKGSVVIEPAEPPRPP